MSVRLEPRCIPFFGNSMVNILKSSQCETWNCADCKYFIVNKFSEWQFSFEVKDCEFKIAARRMLKLFPLKSK